ncbi:uncharacterized protein LOC122626926 [Vespula pensylvanica]|uniref:uncharacterized protein LOC122626926 n=1 Tax=Vespula pensylvanica TaxID=30213 RepID=UPI001CB9DDF3|nr:uncharacterized protein LOC122626926 [Vespula pensylvanica]
MSRQSVVLSFLSGFLFVTLNSVTSKVVPPSPWSSYASKSVYSRSLGPPVSGFSTINVPYMSKSPLFPKFVDPKAMISKKTDLLNNLFGGMGTVPWAADSSKLLPGSPFQYSTVDEQSDSAEAKMNDIAQLYGVSKFKSTLPSQEAKRSATLLADDPESSSKDTASNDKTEVKDSNSSTSDDNSNPEDSQTIEKESNPSKVKEYLPGMFPPFAMDPSMFIEKKYSFLDTLFKNLPTSSTTPSYTETTPKSTIVPPEFWIPNSVIVNPMEYNEKISTFLDKLFENLTLNKTKAEDDTSSVSGKRVARSIEDVSSIIAAKDAFVDTILLQLGNLKNEMISVLNDTLAYQKSSSVPSPIPKKPFLPSMWMKPTVDTLLPLKQKMAFLDQMFDMLLDLQKNVSANILETVKSELNVEGNVQSSNLNDEPLINTDDSLLNQSLLDAIKQSLAQSVQYPAGATKGATKKVARSSPSATSFWVAYPESTHTVAKRHTSANNYQYPLRRGNNFNYPNDKSDPKQSAEMLQKYDKGDADFDYDIDGQRDNIEKFKKYIKWMKYIMNEHKEGRHHHHHYYY